MAFRTVDILADGARLRTGRTHHRDSGFCKGCGRRILWCVTALNEKPIPFDDEPEAEGTDQRVETVSADNVHWRTCPKQADFRKRA